MLWIVADTQGRGSHLENALLVVQRLKGQCVQSIPLCRSRNRFDDPCHK
jgi:hypothetical protein